MSNDTPFAPNAPREFFLETRAGAEILSRLSADLGAREPFVLVVGDAGIGKTTLAHEAITRWGERVTAAFLAYPALTGTELLEEILLRFGTEPPVGATRPRLVAALEHTLADIAGRGQAAVIVVDDAHRLPPEQFEELRLLVNAAQQARRPLEVLLLGLPSLEGMLDDPALASLYQRISLRVKLAPLSPGETRRYLRHRAGATGEDGAKLFPRAVCLEIWEMTAGVPRRINAFGAEALRLARAAGAAEVGHDHVRAAATALRAGIAPRAVDDGIDDEPERAPAPERVAPAPERVAPAPAEPRIVVQPPPPASAQAKVPPPPPSAPTSAPEPAALKSGPAPAPKAAATPPAPAPLARTAPPAASAPPESPRPAPMASQDQREWVARFIGDKGPLQIGSKAAAEASWQPLDEEPESEPARSERPERPAKARPRGKAQAPAPGAPPAPKRPGAGLIATAALAACVMIAVIVAIVRMNGHAPTVAPASNVATPVPPAKPAGRAKSKHSATPGSAARAEAPAVSGDSAAPPDRAVASSGRPWRGPYTIEVATEPDLQRALEVRDRMHELTGIDAWVARAPGDGSAPNRVVVGMFRSQARAQGAADMLIRSKTLTEARVVPMPGPGQRL